MFSKKVPTDLQILSFIYDHYYDEFCRYDHDNTIRSGKVYVPIDCYLIAKKFSVNGDIIFGCLHYHLANQYRYNQSDNTEVKVFELEVDGDPKCVHFPYLASIVSDLRQQNRKYKQTLWISYIAIVISFSSLSVTIYDKMTGKQSSSVQQVQVVDNENITKQSR